MIENTNEYKVYSETEMAARAELIPKIKDNLLGKLYDLSHKIEEEEPFPHGNITLDSLVEIDDSIEEILNKWYY